MKNVEKYLDHRCLITDVCSLKFNILWIYSVEQLKVADVSTCVFKTHMLMTIAHTLLWTNCINVWCRSPSTYSWASAQASNISRHQEFCLSLGEDASLASQAWTQLLRIGALHQTGSCMPPQPTASKHPVSIYMSAQALVLKDTVHAFLHVWEIRSQMKELMLTKQRAPVGSSGGLLCSFPTLSFSSYPWRAKDYLKPLWPRSGMVISFHIPSSGYTV